MAHNQNVKDADNDAESIRLDKWLWAARFYKTRSIAADAVDGGKVHLNAERVKRSKSVRVGDEVQVRSGPYESRVRVLAVSERRGAASVAAELYEELPESITAREALAAQRRLASFPGSHEIGRPSKRERRQIDDFRKRD
ncbi:MAG: RNA-binding S4 domain-containing protein [Gemmatimonadaceae bacterium]